ncbi:bestrophin family protein [Tunicatimonas pelagia]|uniref:bestrophin family protein n=1 Tax=Tunicatimonas pelagia TaxID=931531 RepID=UPI002666B1E5|nr:bestrophin family protein [Tunicatimonas pelagia]WKN44829.1 bestrophin family protein [Tunicatimonas pelagia]
MIVRRNLDPKVILFYSWKDLLYYLLLAVAVYTIDRYVAAIDFHLPFTIVTIISTALAIFLGFNNNQAYDRWWEARKIWGLMVNYSRAWARQASTFLITESDAEQEELRVLKQRMIYRHAAFVHALRVFLRKRHDYDATRPEYMQPENEYADCKHLMEEKEFKIFCAKDNPPNFLNQLQGEDLQRAFRRGWISDFRYVQMDQTLVEFNNIQGRSERIKNTPMPRPYTYFSRVFVSVHATLLPFAFVQELGWMMIPVSFIVSFVFRTLDMIGERTQDPFDNKIDDTPMTSLSVTIERNVKEQWGEQHLPEKPLVQEGIVF